MRVSVRELRHVYESFPRGTAKEKDKRLESALNVTELSIPSGTHQCLIGRSGSGKTTLLNILAGLLSPTQGEIWLGTSALHSLAEGQRDALRARQIGYVFQTSNLLQGLSILENLTLAQHFAGRGGRTARKEAQQLLEQLGLGERAADMPGKLSVGELQRVGIARAVCKKPSLVLADEPTASLDDASAAVAIDLLLSQCAECTLIVASHDSRLIERMAKNGKVVALEGL